MTYRRFTNISKIGINHPKAFALAKNFDRIVKIVLTLFSRCFFHDIIKRSIVFFAQNRLFARKRCNMDEKDIKG